jgi:Growth inhibitor
MNDPLERGDIIFVSNNPKPKNNNEQKDPRPWLVVSERMLNEVSPFVWVVPFTSTKREYPLAVEWASVCQSSTTKGTLLCDQLTSMDVSHRKYKLLEKVEVPEEVDYRIQAVLGYK